MPSNFVDVGKKIQSQLAAPVSAQFVREVQVRLAKYAAERLVERTPVWSGKARGNWQASVNTPILQERPSFPQASPRVRRYVTPPLSEIGQQTVDEMHEVIDTVGEFDNIFLQNNAPHIERLEKGWSPQAQPAGAMVAVTVNELELMAI